MAVNLSGLANSTTSITALSNLVLVSPQKVVGYQPQDPPVQNGKISYTDQALLFNYEGEQVSELKCDITDHFIEDNTAIQDQIAIHPAKVNTKGFIGELTDIVPGLLAPVQFIADKLTTIAAYTPALTQTALLAYQQAFFLYQVAANAVNSAVGAAQTITGNGGESVINGSGQITKFPNQTKQQQMYQAFYGYLNRRTLFTVQTPWAVFQNMAIESLRAIQDAETRMISTFEVSFKQMRFASTQTITVTSDPSEFQGRGVSQAVSNPINLGVQNPSPSNVDFLGTVKAA